MGDKTAKGQVKMSGKQYKIGKYKSTQRTGQTNKGGLQILQKEPRIRVQCKEMGSLKQIVRKLEASTPANCHLRKQKHINKQNMSVRQPSVFHKPLPSHKT